MSTVRKIPDVSIIVTIYNGKKYIDRCISSLLKSKNISYEIIIIDDSSTDGSEKLIVKYKIDNRITGVINSENKGASYSRNKGAKKALADYLVFLDIDCKVQPESIQQLILPLRQNKLIGMTQALLLNPDNTIESSGHFLTIFGFPYNVIDVSIRNEIIFGARTAVAIKRSIFNKIYGYDLDYMIYAEDSDLSWRTWLSGYQVFLAPKAKIIHYQKSSLSNSTSYRLYFEGSKNLINVLLKNLVLPDIFCIMPLHIFCWIGISFILLFRGKTIHSRYILKGIWWNVLNLRDTLHKRIQISKYTKKTIPNEVLFGPLSLIALCKKAVIWGKTI